MIKKINLLTTSIVIPIVIVVFYFSGNWIKSLILLTVGILLCYLLGYFINTQSKNPKTTDIDENISISKKQMWRQIVLIPLVFSIAYGLISGLSKSSYMVDFKRIIIAIVLSFVAAVIGNLLFVKEFRTGNKELEN